MSIELKPFVGPQPFQEDHSSFFYGRDREVQEILTLILSSGVSLIYAKSGIGKTSIFNAKIIPQLQEGKHKFHVLPITRFKAISTLNEANESITEISNVYIFNTLRGIIERSKTKLEVENLSNEKLKKMTLSEFLKEYTSSQREGVDKYYYNIKILIFDQFEEFFNIQINNIFEQQINFFYQIKEALNNDHNFRIVFIMREEFIASLDVFSNILPDGFRRKFRLEPLRKRSAILAVEKPLLRALLLEPRLNDLIDEKDIAKVANKVVENLLKVRVQGEDGKIVVIKKRGIAKFVKGIVANFRKVHIEDEQMEVIIGELVEPVQLQVVCLKLWEKKILTGKIRSEIDSIEFGDVDNALADFYNDAVNAAKDAANTKEHTIREWCEEKLITSAGTRSMVYQDVNNTAGMPNKVVYVLQNKYLIHAEERARGKWFELTHDRMIKPIKDSNRDYEERKKSQQLKIIKIMVPVIVALTIFAIVVSLPYFENINAKDLPKETMIDNDVTIKLSAEQGNKYTYIIKSYPIYGKLVSVSNDTVVYTPDNKYIGHDRLSYVISNGKKTSNTGHIYIHIRPIPLTAMNQTVESVIDRPRILSLIDWDFPSYKKYRDVGMLPIKLPRLLSNNSEFNGPYHGTLAADINSNKIVYTPDKGYNGTDYFEFCLPNPENTTLCSTHSHSFGHVNIMIRPVPKYFGYLMIDNGVRQGTLYPIYSTTNTIGRATTEDKPDIAIQSGAGTVSRLTGKIFYNGSFFLQDLESLNKITSKGKELDHRHPIKLQGGDTFVMGGVGGIRMRLITNLANASQYK